MLTGTKKQYKVSFVFEKETDTEDIWGTVTKTHEPLKQDATIKDTILSFVGEYDRYHLCILQRKLRKEAV